ncbi:putative phosphoribosyl transferase [Enhygromyxa salina]|uniref:Putative phosphoribosyl transferase n=1 Tax=Enhygromyxa salina TaxID=215803 RepID=A0A2S9XIC6_9BACT|nr:phosphoribosyltransferase [Enhygromyxa salina]PRP92625.1 putative phosphoribosyl transferase [Enhygromyxa salina]
MTLRFRDREDAGRQLAMELASYAVDDPIVLALPSGGVPIGDEVARALRAPLDVWVTRKIGVPWRPELGMGAVAEGGSVHLCPKILGRVGLSEEELGDAITHKQREVEAHIQLYRGGAPRPILRDRTVIVIDDGIATGGTIRAAIPSIRAQGPRKIVIAVPVAAPESVRALEPEVDRVICLLTPPNLFAVGVWYENFDQMSDDEAVRVIERARRDLAESGHAVA